MKIWLLMATMCLQGQTPCEHFFLGYNDTRAACERDIELMMDGHTEPFPRYDCMEADTDHIPVPIWGALK